MITFRKKIKLRERSFYKLLNKDIRELNGILVALFSIVFLVGVGFLSYIISNSYALFGDSIIGEKTMEVEVGSPNLDISGANIPVLDEGMIPVYYDETSDVWKKADSTNANETYKWYDYDNKMWANSVTVYDFKETKYLTKQYIGDEVIVDFFRDEVNIYGDKPTLDKNGNYVYSENFINATELGGTTTYGELAVDYFDGVFYIKISDFEYNSYEYTGSNIDVYRHLVEQGIRDEYQNADLGTEIPMDDILTMQVWIPRYKYKVWNYNSDGTVTSEPQEIEIVFEEGTETTGEIECTDTISGTDGAKSESCKINNVECTDSTCNNKYYTHPAFTFGEEETEGFWIGKFELTGDINNITTKPNLTSLRNQTVSSFSSNIMAMNDEGNIYGLSTTTDTHMIKNMEWGAVSYLSHSKYGINREVYINNSGFYTGRSGGNVGGSTPINGTYTDQTSTTQYNTYGFYTYDGYLLEYGTNTKSDTKDISKVSSTTGNIYGVYDMSGGIYEYVMGNIVDSDGTTMRSESSGFTTYPEEKYYDKYSYGTSSSQRIRSKLGDGIKEVFNTSSYGWYDDYSSLANYGSPWFNRGGLFSNGSGAGVMSSRFFFVSAIANHSSRLIITP